MTDDCHVIWSNRDLDYNDWREDLESEYPELTEDERMEKMYEINGDYLGDERMNLNIQVGSPILVIGDLGLWNGRFSGYREIASGNIRDCLYSNYDYATWYVDKDGDFRCDDVHHDGTTDYLYRAFRDGVSEDQMHDLEDKIYLGTATHEDIERITRRLGDEIGKVYGWEFPPVQQAEKQYER